MFYDFANGELRPTHHTEAITLIERDDDDTAIVDDDRGFNKLSEDR